MSLTGWNYCTSCEHVFTTVEATRKPVAHGRSILGCPRCGDYGPLEDAYECTTCGDRFPAEILDDCDDCPKCSGSSRNDRSEDP